MSKDTIDPLAQQVPVRKWKKRAIIALCVVVLGAVGFYTYRAATPQETTYLTMPVTKGKIADVVQATGSVKPLQEADLKFKNDGTLQTLNAKVGQEVVLGQQLAVQDDADLRTAVDQAKNEVTQAQYKYRQAELDLNKLRTTAARQETLYKDGAISLSDIEQARSDVSNSEISRDMAKSSIQSAQVKLQIAENTLKDAVLAAPINGVISSVAGEVGQDSSIVLIHMISPQLQVIAQVNEADISRVKINQNAYLTLTSKTEQRITGKVSQISPQASTVNNIQLYEVSISVDNKNDLLMPGMSVTANIIANQSSSEMALVQNIALTYAQTFQRSQASAQYNSNVATTSAKTERSSSNTGTSNRSFNRAVAGGNKASASHSSKMVVVLKNGKPELKSIQTGLSDGQNTEVISGLETGEEVVIGTSDGTSTDTNSGQSSTRSGTNRNRASGPGPMF